MAEIKSHFLNKNREMRAFPELFDETQIQQLNARIRSICPVNAGFHLPHTPTPCI